jgi:diguanylate cyclase (GGDEF)-like protein/PAS domain S-box-containing protein
VVILLKRIKMMKKQLMILLLGISCLFILIFSGFEIVSMNDENHREILEKDAGKILQDINYLDSNKYYLSQKSIGKTGWTLHVLSDFRGSSLLTPMQIRFITVILVILIALMIIIALLINNIFKRYESEAKLKKLFQAVQQSSSTIVITDTKGVIEYVNPKFTELTGYTIDEVTGKNINILKSDEHESEFYKKMWTTILSGEDWKGSICNKRKSGETYWEDAHISSVKNAKGGITDFIAVKEDITKQREFDEKLNIYATMDEMTGTFNRRSCIMLMEKQIQISKRQNQNFVIFFMDVNGLKSVNDSLGHSYGDELITSAVRAIKACLREADSLCRLGGDEFLVILPNTNVVQAETVLNKIDDEVKKINSEESYLFILSLSFGICECCPESELTVDGMIHIADQKMYENKAEIKLKLGPGGILKKN